MRDWDVSSVGWTPAAAHICWWPGRCSEALNVISGQQSLNKSSRVTFWSRLVWLLDTHTDWAAGGNSGQDSVLQSANYSSAPSIAVGFIFLWKYNLHFPRRGGTGRQQQHLSRWNSINQQLSKWRKNWDNWERPPTYNQPLRTTRAEVWLRRKMVF